LNRQNELIRTLQKQLEATERELADQKWLLDRYLNSPSWRITAPLRWVARGFRAAAARLRPPQLISAVPRFAPPAEPIDAPEPAETFADFKELYTSLQRVVLRSFLNSSARLHFPVGTSPEVSVILVLFNRAELTFACLRSIRETAAGAEVIIVDNNSSDDTPRLVERLDGVRVIRNPENRHFLRAVNQAAEQARGKYLLLLNNDSQLLPGTLRAAIDTLRQDAGVGAVGGRIVLLDGTLQEAGSIVWRNASCLGYGRGDNPFSSPYMFRRDVDYCSGAFLLTPREVWQRLGGFDEMFNPAYYEETDYCMRLWEHGLRVVYEPEAAVLHYEFASSTSSSNAIALQAAHQEVFARRHSAALQRHYVASLDHVLPARSRAADKRILFIDDRVPHPWLGSGFPRARTMLLALRRRGYFVTLFPMAVLDEDWTSIYSDLPREIEVMNEMGPPLLEAFLRNRRDYYDLLIVSRPHNMHYLRPIVEAHPEWFSNLGIVYDAEALFAPRDVGLRQLMGEQLDPPSVEKIYENEIALTSLADCVTAVSEMDRAALAARGVKGVRILGHTLTVSPTPASFGERNGFLFVGAVHDEASPNGDSLIWFLREVWPSIQQRLGEAARLTITGINRSERVRQLSGPGVELRGHLADISGLYNRARVFIAPTRFAAGIPHKIHEAAARGVPVAATSLLARQLQWKDGVELRVADDASAFARQCVELHENAEEWNRTRECAMDAIRRDCSQDLFEKVLAEIVELATGKRRTYASARMES
jgi:O-antigen biosynthesis protein